MTMPMCKDNTTFEDFRSQLMTYDRILSTQHGSNDTFNQMQANVSRFNFRHNRNGPRI